MMVIVQLAMALSLHAEVGLELGTEVGLEVWRSRRARGGQGMPSPCRWGEPVGNAMKPKPAVFSPARSSRLGAVRGAPLASWEDQRHLARPEGMLERGGCAGPPLPRAEDELEELPAAGRLEDVGATAAAATTCA